MTSVLVAGGGVAGAAAACLLAQRGREVLLIEREREPHDKICGEFVSGEAVGALAHLGIDVAGLGAAPIRAVRLAHGERLATARLPFAAWGLSRRVLDESLLARAAELGAGLLRGHAIRGVDARGRGLSLEVDGVGRFDAASVLLATGKHDLRGARRALDRPPEDLIGLKMYFTLAPAERDSLRGHVEIALFDGGYAGLQLVEGDRANLCLLVGRAEFDAAGRCWDGLVEALRRDCPHLDRRLAGASALLARPVSIFRVPYGWVHRPRPDDPAGLFRLGDQAGVIPSFCGDGMAIALHTAFAAARLGDSAAFQRRVRRDLRGQIGLASLLHRAGRAVPGAAVRGAQLWPGAVRWLARLTRAPREAPPGS